MHVLGERPGRGGHQARQPLRCRAGRGHRPRPTAWPTPATRCRPSVASWPSTGRCPRRWPRSWPRCSPRSWWPPGSSPARSSRLTAKKNLRVVEAPRRRPPGLHVRSIDGGLLVQTPDRVTWDRDAFRVVTRAGPHRGRVGRPRAGVAGVRCGDLQHHRAGQGGPGRRHRRRPAEPPRRRAHRGGEGRRAGGRGVPVPATPSSPSGTGWTRRRRPVPLRSCSPAARSATRRSSPPPTRPAWRWCSPANGTSGTDVAAQVLDGESLAAATRAAVATRVQALAARGVQPGLGTVLVGDDGPSARYVAMKHQDCAEVGHRVGPRAPARRRQPGRRAGAWWSGSTAIPPCTPTSCSTRSRPASTTGPRSWPWTPPRTSTGSTR